MPRQDFSRNLNMPADLISPAEQWAATILPASRAHPIAPSDSPQSREPAHADALLAGFAPKADTNTPASPLPISTETDVTRMGVIDLLAAFRSGATTPSALLAILEGRAGADGPAPEAVLARIPSAEAEAAASTERYRNGTARRLEGVPFGVKDIIDAAGARVTCGSLQTGDRIAATDANCVARLRAEGAVPAFMLATTEYACGSPHNARYGAVPNPWDRTRWAGGSSTGSGAALAAAIVPLALGTDTGGSIRIPAACCGITGLKPTRGLIPRTGVATLSWTLDHIGPMARTAADLAVVLPSLAGPDGTDPLAAAHVPDLSRRADIRGLRIGVPQRWFTERCDAAILAAWREALVVLKEAGATLHEVEIPDLALAHEEAWVILYAELASAQESKFGTMDLFDSGTRDRITRGRKTSASDYLRALRRRPLVQKALLDAMSSVDVLVTPGVGAEAPFLDTITVMVDGTRFPMYEVTPRNTMIFDLTGFPALMLPSGTGQNRLPIAIQIVARPFDDMLCLSAGIAFQSRTTHHLRRLEE
jgi:aspartyl-tRNA(Asn)/glutamyl-tRNA(Gln) amidotransferase subunit A